MTPVLLVPDELENVTGDDNTQGIQVYGIRSENVTFELTITFQDDPLATNPVNTRVTGFEVEDINLVAADSSNQIISGGATASAFRSKANDSVYTTTITARGNVNTVLINISAGAADTPGTVDPNFAIVGNVATQPAEQ